MVTCPICGEQQNDTQSWMDHTLQQHPDNVNMLCQRSQSM